MVEYKGIMQGIESTGSTITLLGDEEQGPRMEALFLPEYDGICTSTAGKSRDPGQEAGLVRRKRKVKNVAFELCVLKSV